MAERYSSFEELAQALSDALNGDTTSILREDRRVEVETTDSIFASIMPGGYPSPEAILLGAEIALETEWHLNLSIEQDLPEFVKVQLAKLYR